MSRKPWDAKRLKKLRRLILKGTSDREIAKRLECHYSSVARERKKFGLEAVGHRNDVLRQKRSKMAIKRNREMCPIIAQCKAAEMGWPDAEGTGQARVLDVLLEHGDNTAVGIARILRYRPTTAHAYLHRLHQMNLVAPSGKTEATCINHPNSNPRIIWRLTINKHQTNIKHSNNYDIDGKRKN